MGNMLRSVRRINYLQASKVSLIYSTTPNHRLKRGPSSALQKAGKRRWENDLNKHLDKVPSANDIVAYRAYTRLFVRVTAMSGWLRVEFL